MIPLGMCFEQKNDSALTCFERLLDFLFKRDGQNNQQHLRNVNVHSDRGYMLPNVVFEYLLPSGADVVGTVKRMAQCWPYTYNQKVKDTDKRTMIDVKGAPTLYMKKIATHQGKSLSASAFRNGSQSVATAVSSIHPVHQWEGVVLNQNDRLQYSNDSSSLVEKFFERLETLENRCDKVESDVDKELINEVLENKIIPMTLKQGK